MDHLYPSNASCPAWAVRRCLSRIHRRRIYDMMCVFPDDDYASTAHPHHLYMWRIFWCGIGTSECQDISHHVLFGVSRCCTLAAHVSSRCTKVFCRVYRIEHVCVCLCMCFVMENTIWDAWHIAKSLFHINTSPKSTNEWASDDEWVSEWAYNKQPTWLIYTKISTKYHNEEYVKLIINYVFLSPISLKSLSIQIFQFFVCAKPPKCRR